MAKFTVTLRETVIYTVEVEAEDEETTRADAVESWNQSEDPSNDFCGSGQGVEVDDIEEAVAGNPWAEVAASEGWGIFETNADKAEQLFLMKDDEAAKFATDADAWLHVWQRAKAGSEPHKAALAYLERESPVEYADMAKFCEDAS